MAQKNMRDLGLANGWDEDSLEQRLVDMTIKAGYRFLREKNFDKTGQDVVYVCKKACLKYHVCYN